MLTVVFQKFDEVQQLFAAFLVKPLNIAHDIMHGNLIQISTVQVCIAQITAV